jgi:hypothetical protein
VKKGIKNMYLIKSRETNRSLVLCRTEIALEAALQMYESDNMKVYVEWTDKVELNNPMEQ